MDYQTIKRVKNTAKRVKKILKPDLTLMQIQHEIAHQMGFRNWTDFLNTSFSDDYINHLLENFIFNISLRELEKKQSENNLTVNDIRRTYQEGKICENQ